MQTTCKLYAKIIKTNKNTVRVLYSFNNLQQITVLNCAYTSGDLGTLTKKNVANVVNNVTKTHNFVTKAFSTNNIVVLKDAVQDYVDNLKT